MAVAGAEGKDDSSLTLHAGSDLGPVHMNAMVCEIKFLSAFGLQRGDQLGSFYSAQFVDFPAQTRILNCITNRILN